MNPTVKRWFVWIRLASFLKSEDLRQALERIGVVDQPDVYFLDLIGRPSAQLAQATGTVLFFFDKKRNLLRRESGWRESQGW